ncbi:MAG: aminoacyl-tRNA hydrolase [Alphaproteobacteria bacterium]|nr:aminoacyl-tRNA hydrolase [Alphaproteobacteria bacterium]
MAGPLTIHERLEIPAADLSVSYVRAGGPGGQHVNTSDTAVRLRFALDANTTLHPTVKARIKAAHPSLVTQDGELLIQADRHRSQTMNLDDACSRLVDIVRNHLVPPKPRRPTRPTKGSQQRRLAAKTRRGAIKQHRGKVGRDD